MTTYMPTWTCNPADPTAESYGFSSSEEQHDWYYDGALVYLKMADYTGDIRWKSCATNILDQYTISNSSGTAILQGSPPGYACPGGGWHCFPWGMLYASTRYGITTYLGGLHDISQNSSYTVQEGDYPTLAGGGWPGDDSRVRETSYALNVLVTDSQAGHALAANTQHVADLLIGYLLDYTDTNSDGTLVGRYTQNQPFMTAGLAPTALIKYWQLTADPRVPYVVKRILDLNWGGAVGTQPFYSTSLHSIMANVDPQGPKCATLQAWFVPDVSGHCAGDSTNGYAYQITQGLLPYNYAWLWSVTGNSTYQTEGDDIFAHAMDNAPSTGKEQQQNYMSAFEFVKLRSSPGAGMRVGSKVTISKGTIR